MQMIQEHKGEVNKVDDAARTPLHLAAQLGRDVLVAQLLKHG